MLADLREKTRDVQMETVQIDFDGVRSVSYSFIDEFIGELVQAAGAKAPRCINVPSDAARAIERSLKCRGLEAEHVLSDALEAA
jgi:hypothetical protein